MMGFCEHFLIFDKNTYAWFEIAKREVERERHTHRDRERDRERQRETERDRERETERDRERQRETERDRETETERGKHHLGKLWQGKVSSLFEILSLFPEKNFLSPTKNSPCQKVAKQTLFRTICKNLYKWISIYCRNCFWGKKKKTNIKEIGFHSIMKKHWH